MTDVMMSSILLEAAELVLTLICDGPALLEV